MTRVADLMSPCSALRPEESLAQAARALWDGACDGLPVVDEQGRLVGFVSDRDVAMCVAIEGRTVHELTVSRAMTAAAEGLAPKASLADAHAYLRGHLSRRAPVIDAERTLLGVLTFDDLVRDSSARPTARKAAADVRATLEVLAGVEQEQAFGPRPQKAAAREVRPTATAALKTTGGHPAAAAARAAAKSADAKTAAKGATAKKAAPRASVKKASAKKAAPKATAKEAGAKTPLVQKAASKKAARPGRGRGAGA